MQNLQLPSDDSCQDKKAQLKESKQEIQSVTFLVRLAQVNSANVGVRQGRRPVHTNRQLHRCMTRVLPPVCLFTDLSGAAGHLMGLMEDPEMQRRKKSQQVRESKCQAPQK